MAAAYLNDATLSQGSDYSENLSILDSAGDPLNLSSGHTALFQIRAGTVDSGAPALVTLTDEDGIFLGNGSATIEINAETTRAAVSATTANKLWAELDITHTETGVVTSYRWGLAVEREYARAES